MQVDIRGFEGPLAATTRQFVSPEEGWWIRGKGKGDPSAGRQPFFQLDAC
jgi:hypothetical protein